MMNGFLEKSTQNSWHSTVDSINLTALQLHKSTMLACKSNKATTLGFYRFVKKVQAIMPLPFLKEFSVVRLIMKKVKNLPTSKSQKITTSLVILKPAHSKRVKLRHYIHRLVRRRS